MEAIQTHSKHLEHSRNWPFSGDRRQRVQERKARAKIERETNDVVEIKLGIMQLLIKIIN